MSRPSFINLLILSSTLCCMSQLALADTDYTKPYKPANNYIGANIGFFEIYSLADPLDRDQNTRPITYNLSIGHIFNQRWAIEAGYTFASYIYHSNKDYYTTVQYPDILMRYTLKQTQHVNIYTKFGAGFIFENNQGDLVYKVPAPYIGIGFNWHLASHTDLNVDITGPTLGIITLANISAGLAFKF